MAKDDAGAPVSRGEFQLFLRSWDDHTESEQKAFEAINKSLGVLYNRMWTLCVAIIAGLLTLCGWLLVNGDRITFVKPPAG